MLFKKTRPAKGYFRLLKSSDWPDVRNGILKGVLLAQKLTPKFVSLTNLK